MPTNGKIFVAHRRRRQCGHAMIEFAFAGLLSLALMTASFDFSRIIFSRTMLRQAVREGVRFATSGRTVDGLGQDASIRRVVMQGSFGILTGNENKIKIRYYNRETGVQIADGLNSNAQGNLVEVALDGFTISSIATVMRADQVFSLAMAGIGAVEPYPGAPPIR
jgi:Flp pilus assembly protein TadG